MLTKVISFEKHLRQNCQIKGGGGQEEKREAREKASELGRAVGSWVARKDEDVVKEREREREKVGGRQKELRRE